jgi:hypothetical protein
VGYPPKCWGYTDTNAAGGKAEPKAPVSLKRNVATPYISHTGRRAARPTDRCAGTGWRKKRRPPCNRVDKGFKVTLLESGQTSAWSFMARELGHLGSGGKR